MTHELLDISTEVADALDAGRPVVALESNLITHGLAYPANVETATAVEQAVRAGGAVPATVCLDGGRLKVGMTAAEIERFGAGSGIPKASSRDLPVLLARGGPGATTIAATLVVADLAGIAFLASAGIGGVHRGAEASMDISGDLIQFTRSRVALVCAGAKSILDLDLTMEYLETQNVPVLGYRSDYFPAFYCVSSGIRVPQRLDDPTLVAAAVEYHWALGNRSSVLITSPTRAEDAIDQTEVDTAIAAAIDAAARDGVRGNAITKYLMRAVDRATEGRSAAANRAVVISTAELAGRLATAHAEYRWQHQPAAVGAAG